ncbi:hypothetical protein Scep_008098 [Stephania cephalantha]|uniref:Uncharacterized protein n=1 Tax=Stephania cephalantha TaxID=152367 RepID=A0AAP0KB19_9MAGN
MTRRCSHCSNNGHNSRTCPTRGGGVRLFGVRLTDGSIIKKSASMGNLSSPSSSNHYHSSSSAAASPSPNPSSPSENPLRGGGGVDVAEGYVSDDPAHASCSSNCRADRKKGIPWTEEEHRLFLMGLQKLGKGDWRGIARNFVISRTPTQVASHAQKYFIRQSNSSRRKRRSSLFDMVPDMPVDPVAVQEEPFVSHSSKAEEVEDVNQLPSLQLSLDPEFEPMETASNETSAEETATYSGPLALVPTYMPTYVPVPFPFWPTNLTANEEEKHAEAAHHQVLKPTPILSKNPVNIDELLGMSKLTLGANAAGRIEPSPLSAKLLGTSSRQSAFHVNQPGTASDLTNSDGKAIPAV